MLGHQCRIGELAMKAQDGRYLHDLPNGDVDVEPGIRARVTRRKKEKRNQWVRWDVLFQVVGTYKNSASGRVGGRWWEEVEKSKVFLRPKFNIYHVVMLTFSWGI